MTEVVKELRIEWNRNMGTGEIEGAPCCPGAPDVTDCLGCPNQRGFVDPRFPGLKQVHPVNDRTAAEAVRCAHPSFQEAEAEAEAPTIWCPEHGNTRVVSDKRIEGRHSVTFICGCVFWEDDLVRAQEQEKLDPELLRCPSCSQSLVVKDDGAYVYVNCVGTDCHFFLRTNERAALERTVCTMATKLTAKQQRAIQLLNDIEDTKNGPQGSLEGDCHE